MSRWRALAAVHDVPDSDLRDRLVDATETLLYVADLLGVSPHDGAILPALEELKESADHSDEVLDLEANLSDAEERLRKVDDLEAERDSLAADVERLQAQLAAAKPLIDAYSDAVRFARRFVSVGERAGVPLKFCRVVPGRGKPANANARKR